MSQEIRKKKVKKKIIFDSLTVFFLAMIPFLYKVYEYFPAGDASETFSILGITIDSNGYNNVSTYIWFMTGKIVPFFIIVFWFFTSKEWWYHILLIPMAMYAFQIFEELFDSDNNIDTENLLWLLPVCMVVIPFVYFIRVKIYDKYVNGIDLEAMDAELKELKEKERQRELKKEAKEKKVS